MRSMPVTWENREIEQYFVLFLPMKKCSNSYKYSTANFNEFDLKPLISEVLEQFSRPYTSWML
jgi:hypothetical protein